MPPRRIVPTPPVLTTEELEALMERVITRTLIRCGIAQSDDREAVELQKDFSYLRDLRLGSQAIKNKGVLAVLGVIGTGILTLIYFGIQFFVTHPSALPPPGHP